MNPGNGDKGWTLIETIVLVAIILILTVVFFPKIRGTYLEKETEACAKVFEMNKGIDSDIERLISIIEMPEPQEKRKSMEQFRASESGIVFYEEFCPALAACEDSLEIKWKYSIPLTLLCQEE